MPNTPFTGATGQSITDYTGIAPNVLQFPGIVGDGINDDTVGLQKAFDSLAPGIVMDGRPARALRLVAGKRYKITDTLVVSNDLYLYADHINWAESPQSAVIAMTDPTKDIIRCDANTAHFKGIVFTHHAGHPGRVTGTTPSTITFDELHDVYFATVSAPALTTGLQVYCYRMYSNAGNVYRMKTVGGAGLTVGATKPTHTSGTVTIDGIAWEWFKAGTTYPRGQYNNNGAWWFTSVSGNVLQDVTPLDQSSVATPNDYDGAGHAISERGYFVSNEFQAQDGTNTAAAIHFTAGNDSQVEGCWFNVVPACAIKLDSGVQGGMWRHSVIDNAYYGMLGSFAWNKIHDNRFFNCQVSIKATKWWRVQEQGSFHAQCGLCYDIQDATYSAALPLSAGSNVEWSSLSNIHAETCQKFAYIRGAKGLRVGGTSQVIRCQSDPVIELIESDSCIFRDIHFAGAGEVTTDQSSYFKLSGNNYQHNFEQLRFQRINPAEHATKAMHWVGTDLSDRSVYRSIDIDAAYALSNTQYGNNAEVAHYRGATSNRVITSETLVCNRDPQAISYSGNATGTVVVRLSRQEVIEGAFFKITLGINVVTGGSLAFVDDATSATLLTVATPDGFIWHASYTFAYGRDILNNPGWYLASSAPETSTSLTAGGVVPMVNPVGGLTGSIIRQYADSGGEKVVFYRTNAGIVMALQTPSGNLLFDLGTSAPVLKSTSGDIIFASASGAEALRINATDGTVTAPDPGNTAESLVTAHEDQTLKNKTIKASENHISLDDLDSILIKDDAGYIELQTAAGATKFKVNSDGHLTQKITALAGLTDATLSTGSPVITTIDQQPRSGKINLASASHVDGVLAVANGGTGATTEADARTALGVAASGHDHAGVYASKNVVSAGSATLAKLTPGGANGSLTWNDDGQITGYTPPT